VSHQFGFFIGPPIGGLIIDLVHWRGIFFLLFLPSLAGVALCYFTGRSVPATAPHGRSIDYRGTSLFLGLTILITLLLDQKLVHLMGLGGQTILAAAFVGTLWGFIAHEKNSQSPMIDLKFFSLPIFGFGSAGLLICCITQGLTTFVTPFYLQDILKLSPTFIGVIFLAPSLLSMVLSPVSGALTDRIGARFLLLLGMVILLISYFIGATLRVESHWILPALLLSLTGIGSAFFNTPSQAVMIGSLPKENWGAAIGIINGIFGLGHMLGISASGIILTLAFRYYSGIAGTMPDPANREVFVASLNVTYLFAIGISLIPLLTSMRMKKPQ
jgi:MFS family permease